MKICGLQKTTLLDYPGHVAATVFLNGCNFRCPFCHNGDLLGNDAEELMTREDLLSFLKKRSGVLEGVCITGGEPTLHPELPDLLSSIRNLGFLIKLDSNGCQPDVLKCLADIGLVDYIAMDIKNCKEKYPISAGVSRVELDALNESVDFLIHSAIPYEFRTTVTRELHCMDDFLKIGSWIRGARHYFLQNYVDSPQVLIPQFTECTKEALLSYADAVKPYVKEVSLRGLDY